MSDSSISRRALLKYGIGAAVALPTASLLQACSSAATAGKGSTASTGSTVTLKMSSSLTTGPNSAHWVWYNKFSTLLDQKTNGQVKINYYPNSQLGQEAQIVQQVALGTVDMMVSGSSIWADAVPEFSVLDMGYIFQNWDGVGKSLDGSAGTKLNQLLQSKSHAQILGWAYNFGARNVCTKTAVPTPPALHGLKIRVLPVPNFVATLKLMGAVSVPLAFGEVYTSLQTGVIDGLEHDAPTILANKFYEVAKHIALTQHIYNPITAVISNQSLAKVPTHLHSAFMDAAKEATTYQRGLAVSTEQKAFATLKQNGVQVNTIDRAVFKQDVQPLWSQFTTKYPDTKPILDAILSAQS